MAYTFNTSNGVYIIEQDRTARVTPIATSIAAIVQASKRGPLGRTLVTNQQEYRDLFGDPDPMTSLASYCALEFLKIGQRLYVTRTVDDALHAGVIVSRTAANKLAQPVGNAVAGLAGAMVNGSYSYRIAAVDDVGSSLASVAAAATVVSSPTYGSFSTALAGSNNDLKFTAVTAGVTGNSNSIRYVDPAANNAALSVVITPFAGYATIVVNLATDGTGAITTTANDILVALTVAGASFSDFMSVAYVTGNDGSGLVIALAISPLVGGAATGASDGSVTVSWNASAFPSAKQFRIYGRTAASEALLHTVTAPTSSWIDTGALTVGAALASAVTNTSNDLKILPFALGLEDPANEYVFQPDDLFIAYEENPGEWGNGATELSGLSVSITKTNTTNKTFFLNLYQQGQATPVEPWEVSLVNRLDGFGRQLNMEERINRQSRRLRVKVNPDLDHSTQFVNSVMSTAFGFAGGTDGTTITDADIMNGWDLYADPEQVPVRLLINGGYATPAVQRKMAEIASLRRDCFAILDTPGYEQETEAAVNYRNSTLNMDSSYAALYTSDQLVVDQANDLTLYVPPSGFVASAFAYTDKNAASWFAPAGIERGNVNSLSARHKYNQGQRDQLYDAQVNVIRTFVGGGQKIWDQQTLQFIDSHLRYINVRMLMIYISAAVSRYLLRTVFEPNDPILRNDVKDTVEAFLAPIAAARGLQGGKGVGYEVVCDTSNNTPDGIDSGELYVDGYFKPTIPARKVIFRGILIKTGASFKEEILATQGIAA